MIESLLPGYVQFGQLAGALSVRGNQIADAFADAGIKIRKADSLTKHSGESSAGIFPLMVCPSLPEESPLTRFFPILILNKGHGT